ncbi:MAG: YihY/virulence factor BrkB family protein [Clostridiales bacterium]|nr:YihY/virulence factor BrkB family protein [Clostridiales bacterium]
MKKEKNSISKMDLLIHLIVKVKNDDIFALASQLAYYLVLSFFPFLIFLISLISMINININEVYIGLKDVLPSNVYELVQGILIEVFNSQSAGVLGASIFIAIWVASSGFRGVIKGINKAYNLEDNRSFIKKTIIAYISTILLAFTILLALIVLVFGTVVQEHLIEILPFKEVILIFWNIIRYGIILIVLFFVFASIYRYTPCRKIKWKEVIPGAMVSTVGWVISSIAFAFYINNFNNYSKFYGSLAAVFILMIWIFLTSIILIFGVEVNSVLVYHREDKI